MCLAKRTISVALVLGACLVGCATVPTAPSEESAKARQLAVPEGKALVYVFRPGLLSAQGNLQLYANQEFIGDIAAGTFYVLEVEPGDLRLDSPFGNGVTSLDLKVEAGRRYYVSQWIETTFLVLVSVYKARLTQVSAEDGASSLGSLVRVVQLKPHADEDRLARELKAPPDRALVYVFCGRWLGPGFNAEIQVNGRPVGKLAARSFMVTEVAPGPVTIIAKAEKQGTLLISLTPGTTAYVEVQPGAGFFTPGVEPRQVSEERGRVSLVGLRLAPATVAASRPGDPRVPDAK